MKFYDRKFIAALLVTIVIACGIAGYVIYTRTLTSKIELYTAVSHILFEDASHDLLGKLTGKLEIAQTSPSTIVSTFTLTFSSERLKAWHEPYINKVTLETQFLVMFFESVPHFTELPLPQRQTLNDGGKVVFYKASSDISKLEQPMIHICCVLCSCQSSEGTIYPIQLYFSDGQVWRYDKSIYPLWQDKYEYPPAAIGVKLSELSGETETTTITLSVP